MRVDASGEETSWKQRSLKRAIAAERSVRLPGKVRDLTTGAELPKSDRYALKGRHIYEIAGTDLPVTVG